MSDIDGWATDTTPLEYQDVNPQRPTEPFENGWLHSLYRRRVLNSDNDLVVVIAAASKSAISGVGKTTLGIELARAFDNSQPGFNAEDKATLDAGTFSHDLLTDEERVPDQSAVIFDEAQGTLADSGADARRSMAQSVMDVTTAISTLRFRQCTCVIVSQSTKWIDKRIDDILDALILIQEEDPITGEVRAEIFDTYYNDLESSGNRHTEWMDSITWEPLPKSDPDYQHLHERKQESALNKISDGDEEDQSLPKEQQVRIAQEMRNKGFTLKEISNSELIEYGKSWVGENTETVETDQ